MGWSVFIHLIHLLPVLQEAMGMIQKAQAEERRTYFDNTGVSEQLPMECRVPPPPILLCRTDRTMVFRPAPFLPMSGQKVSSGKSLLALLHGY